MFDTQPVCRGVTWRLEPVRLPFFGHLLCKKGRRVCQQPRVTHFTQNGQMKGDEVFTMVGWGTFLQSAVVVCF